MATDLGETEEGLVLATASSTDIGDVPRENTATTCRSCGAKVTRIYCGQCGQKNDDLRRSLWRLISETLGDIFSFESRMWRTWGALLFKPGKVAYEYANGARSRYSPPIRVYLVVSFVLFGFLAVTQTNLFAMSVHPKTETGKTEQAEPDSETIALINDFNFKLLFFQSEKTFEAMLDKTATDNFLDSLKDDINKEVTQPGDQVNADSLDAFKIFLQNPSQFNAAFNTWLPRIMFFMVPFAMFAGAIFIRGPTALLYDHLIHAIYIHAVFFLTLPPAILLARIVPGDIVAKGLLLLYLVYLPISLKHMFKRSWFKTVMTTFVVGNLYAIFLMFAIIMISIYSLASLSA